MGNFGLNPNDPWFCKTDIIVGFISKQGVESVRCLLFECTALQIALFLYGTYQRSKLGSANQLMVAKLSILERIGIKITKH